MWPNSHRGISNGFGCGRRTRLVMVSKYISAEKLSQNAKSQIAKIRARWEIINASHTHLSHASRNPDKGVNPPEIYSGGAA